MPLATPAHHWNPHVHAWNAAGTFTGSVPKPTETFWCDKSVGAIHHATNGKGFQLACNATFTGHDLSNLQVAEWAECMEACSVTPGCKAFTFVPIIHDMINCYLKNAGNPALWSHEIDYDYIGWMADSLWTWTTDVWTSTTVVQTSTTVVQPSITIRPTETQAPLVQAAYSPLSTYRQLVSREAEGWHTDCFFLQWSSMAHINTLNSAAAYFCAGGAPDQQPGFGGFYPDGVLMDGDAVTLEWTLNDPNNPDKYYALFISVQAKPGCAIDFSSLDSIECVDYLTADLCFHSNPVTFEKWSAGGWRENDCTYWIIDPNETTVNSGPRQPTVENLPTVVANGPLLQRSSNTVLGELVGDVVWNWHLAQEISGQMVGNVDREVPANVSVFELVQSATQGWYANKTIQDTGYPLCDGICPVTLRMPGVAVSCASEDISMLMIESRFAKMIGPGPTCQALMQIDRGVVTMDLTQTPRVDGLTPSKGDSSSTPDGQPAGPLAALGWMAEYYLKSSATMSHEQNTTEYFWETQGVLANQYINFEEHFDCVPLFRSPTEYIQRSIHEVMFRIGWDAPKDNSTAAIKFETVIQQRTPSTICQSNYTTMAVAISIMVITALATAALLWPGGFFGIKRPVSLSPIETAVVLADE
ncbi:hypothetical protein V8F06_004476 [Rhypophila decipiens]